MYSNISVGNNQYSAYVFFPTFAGDYDWKNGRVSGCVYRDVDDDFKQLLVDVYGAASYTNPLHPDVFPGVCKMEAEVVRIACRLFGGDDQSCGTVRRAENQIRSDIYIPINVTYNTIYGETSVTNN